jgi:hypothetical protein
VRGYICSQDQYTRVGGRAEARPYFRVSDLECASHACGLPLGVRKPCLRHASGSVDLIVRGCICSQDQYTRVGGRAEARPYFRVSGLECASHACGMPLGVRKPCLRHASGSVDLIVRGCICSVGGRAEACPYGRRGMVDMQQWRTR